MKRSYAMFAAIALVAILNVSCGEEEPVKKPLVTNADAFDANAGTDPNANANDWLATGDNGLSTTPDPALTSPTDTSGGFMDMFSGLLSGMGGSSGGSTDPNAGPLSKFFSMFSSMGGGSGLGDLFGG